MKRFGIAGRRWRNPRKTRTVIIKNAASLANWPPPEHIRQSPGAAILPERYCAITLVKALNLPVSRYILNPPRTTMLASPQLDLLQALRAVAALMVVADHSILNLVIKGALDESKRELAFVFAGGVYIFFAISGFVMIYTSQNMFGVPGSPGSFLARRFFRIAPLYWMLTLFVLLKLAASGALVPPSEILRSFCFIPYLDHEGKFRPVFPLGWTLNYEMFFYAVFSVALFFNKIIGVVLIYVAIGGSVLCGILWRPIEIGGGIGQILAFWTDPVMLMFLVGISLGLLRNKLSEMNRLSPLGFNRGFCLSLAIFCVVLAVTYIGSPAWRIPALAAGVSLMAALCSIDSNVRASLLEGTGWTLRKLLLDLGKVSYSIYLTHIFLVAVFSSLWSRFAPAVLWPFFVLIMIVGASALGHFTYKFVERPLTAWFQDHWAVKKLIKMTPRQKKLPQIEASLYRGSGETVRVTPVNRS